MKHTKDFLVLFSLLALAFSFASAYDPNPLQDFCVAANDPKSTVFLNGRLCKDPSTVTADDFHFSGLNIPTNLANPLGFNFTFVSVDQMPGLNTLSTSIARADLAPNGGVVPPHIHPRSIELIYALEGSGYVGFLSSDNRLFSKILNPGDVFVIPSGVVHFLINTGKVRASAITAFNSQNPGTINVPSAIFGSKPAVNVDLLAKSFHLDKSVVLQLQKVFGGN